MAMGIDVFQALEWGAVVMGVIYIYLLIQENIWCWFFGIVSSVCFIFLMYNKQLYSESILYGFYVFVGFYGWFKWSKKDADKVVISEASPKMIFGILLLGIISSFAVGSFFDAKTDAARPFADATTSVFSVLASFMEAYKWLSSWIFWIVINFCSIWLYFDRALNISSMLMVIYFLLSIFGYMHWRKSMHDPEIPIN